MNQQDVDEVYRLCAGHWESILRALSHVDLNDALTHKGRHVHCHAGHSKSRKFRLFPDFDETGGAICSCGSWSDGFALLNHLNGWDRKTAFREIIRYLKDSGYRSEPSETSDRNNAIKRYTPNPGNVEKLNAVWEWSHPLEGSLGETYLRERGIKGELPNSGDVRFCESLPYWDEETSTIIGNFPAIVSLVRSPETGHPLTIHRTYLDPLGGKAKVGMPKKLMGVSIDGAMSRMGGAIMAYRLDRPVIAITEGLETACAVRSAHPKLPVWSAYSATVLTNFRPPKGVKSVVIFGDVDESGTGQTAAMRLAIRLEASGICTKVLLPSKRVAIPPPKSGHFTQAEPCKLVAEGLKKVGYEITDDCADIDWLDVWLETPERLTNCFNR